MTGGDPRVINNRIAEVEPGVPFQATVGLGSTVVFACPDASGDCMRPGAVSESAASGSGFSVCGPVAVNGVEAGDWIGIEVDSIEATSKYGHVWQRPGLGLFQSEEVAVQALSLSNPTVHWLRAEAPVTIPRNVHVGTLGVLPTRHLPARDVGQHGGNLDFFQLGVGATLWLRAQVQGGGLYAGDAHFAIGDAEIGGTGIEIPARIEVRIRKCADPRFHPIGSWPRVTRGGRVWILSAGRSVEQAVRFGIEEACRSLVHVYSITRAEALMASSCLLDLHVCQMVNPHVTVAVSLRSGADVALMGEAAK